MRHSASTHLCLIGSILLLCLLTGCQWTQSQKPSILVIAVDSLKFSDLTCREDSLLASGSHFNDTCNEFVRFTHAYAPSTQSVPSLVSLLTGQYPHQHQVWNNGNNFLDPKITTVTEKAIANGYRTSFFSGGAPVWSRSGVNQGFESFNDLIKVNNHTQFRSASGNTKLFINWLSSLGSQESFFTGLYLSDLQHPEVATKSDVSGVRSRTVKSQIEEMKESIGKLFVSLKKMKRWHNTYIILVGLNGRLEKTQDRQFPNFQVNTENTLVSLYIKPPGQPRDLPIHWKIDANVSLVDVGITLFEAVGATPPENRDSFLETTSLLSTLDKPTVSWNEDRYILSEASWGQWRGLSPTRYGLRKGYYYIIYDKKMMIYNTLTDRNESNPLSPSEAVWQELAAESKIYFDLQRITPWTPPDDEVLDKISVSRNIFLDKIPKPIVNKARYLVKKNFWEDEISRWLAQYYINKGYWDSLFQLGKESDRTEWVYLSQRQLSKMPNLNLNHCLSYLSPNIKTFKRPRPNICDDTLLIKALEWTLEKNKTKRNSLFEVFWSEYKTHLIYEKIAVENYQKGHLWDTPSDRPTSPLLVDIYLHLPRNKPFLAALKRRIDRVK